MPLRIASYHQYPHPSIWWILDVPMRGSQHIDEKIMSDETLDIVWITFLEQSEASRHLHMDVAIDTPSGRVDRREYDGNEIRCAHYRVRFSEIRGRHRPFPRARDKVRRRSRHVVGMTPLMMDGKANDARLDVVAQMLTPFFIPSRPLFFAGRRRRRIVFDELLKRLQYWLSSSLREE